MGLKCRKIFFGYNFVHIFKRRILSNNFVNDFCYECTSIQYDRCYVNTNNLFYKHKNFKIYQNSKSNKEINKCQ